MVHIENFDFKGLKAIVRVDFNVPLNDQFQITDDTRIRAALPTIQRIRKDGGMAILMSHLGRPKGGPEDKFSLRHLVGHLSTLLGVDVKFASDCIGATARDAIAGLKAGDVLLLENLRFYKQEEKGDPDFSKELASLADVYVNDAFGTAHRAHASTTIIAGYFADNKKMFGFLMDKEVRSIDKVLFGAQKPFTAVLGGAKVSSKITIIEKLLEKVDHLIIGGGMMFTFIKASGGQTGSSLVEDEHLGTALRVLEVAKAKGVSIHLATDAVLADRFANDAATRTGNAAAIETGWMGLDIGPEAIKSFSEVIRSSRTLLWNGPMGVFEMPSFEKGTKAIALAIAEATKAGAFSLVGGGDSVAAVNQLGLADQVGYVSTGGGALLEYLEFMDLPGIKAIRG